MTLQQGIDDIRRSAGAAEARAQLIDRASRIRAAIGLSDVESFEMYVGNGARQQFYAAGNIVARRYDSSSLPTEPQLRRDLRSMLRVLDAAAGILDGAEIADIEQPSSWLNDDSPGAARERVRMRRSTAPSFTPKSSADYTAEIKGGTQRKTRLHESVVNDLERQLRASGWTVSSEHPLDLVLRPAPGVTSPLHIVEVKTVRSGDSVNAVRAALGQLYTYRHLLFYHEREQVRLVAAFSEDVGEQLRELLSQELGIAVMWLEARAWRGCDIAKARSLLPQQEIVET